MASDQNCLFCKIVVGQIPSARVYEDDKVYVFMNLQQTQPGHALIIPKDHYANVFEMPDELLGAVASTSKKIALAAMEAFQADGIQLLQNNNAPAWQTVFHHHQHVIPRYKGDIGHDLYAIWTKGRPASPEELETNAAKLRSALK